MKIAHRRAHRLIWSVWIVALALLLAFALLRRDAVPGAPVLLAPPAGGQP